MLSGNTEHHPYPPAPSDAQLPVALDIKGYVELIINHERELRIIHERYQVEKVALAQLVADKALHEATNNVNNRIRILERTGDLTGGRDGLSQQLVIAIALALGGIGGTLIAGALK